MCKKLLARGPTTQDNPETQRLNYIALGVLVEATALNAILQVYFFISSEGIVFASGLTSPDKEFKKATISFISLSDKVLFS